VGIGCRQQSSGEGTTPRTDMTFQELLCRSTVVRQISYEKGKNFVSSMASATACIMRDQAEI
jgi:hypothetical protein